MFRGLYRFGIGPDCLCEVEMGYAISGRYFDRIIIVNTLSVKNSPTFFGTVSAWFFP